MSTEDESNVVHGLSALKATKYGKQFHKDTWDLFCSLALVLRPRLQKQRPFKAFPDAFLGTEAIRNLASLKFHRSPDYRDLAQVLPSSIVSLKLLENDAKILMQNFMEARLIKDATTDDVMALFKIGGIYQFTSKGLLVLAEFMELNTIGSDANHLVAVLSTLPVPRPSLGRSLERRVLEDDSLIVSQSVATNLFRHFLGDMPNYKPGNGTGVRLIDPVVRNRLLSETFVAGARPFGGKVSSMPTTHCFEVSQMINWLCGCTSINAHADGVEMGAHFVRFDFIVLVGDKARGAPGTKVVVNGPVSRSNPLIPAQGMFLYSRTAIYAITDEGRRVAGWIAATAHPHSHTQYMSSSAEPQNTGYQRLDDNFPDPSPSRPLNLHIPLDEKKRNSARLKIFINDPRMRLLFRDYLKEKSCEYYLSFWVDVEDFRNKLEEASSANSALLVPDVPIASNSRTPFESLLTPTHGGKLYEGLSEAPFLIYNTYLAPTSTCKLRSEIGNDLAQELQKTLEDILEFLTTKALFADVEPVSSSTLDADQLELLFKLYGRIQSRVFRIMVGKYVSKFIKSPTFLAASLIETVDEPEVVEEAREK